MSAAGRPDTPRSHHCMILVHHVMAVHDVTGVVGLGVLDLVVGWRVAVFGEIPEPQDYFMLALPKPVDVGPETLAFWNRRAVGPDDLAFLEVDVHRMVPAARGAVEGPELGRIAGDHIGREVLRRVVVVEVRIPEPAIDRPLAVLALELEYLARQRAGVGQW